MKKDYEDDIYYEEGIDKKNNLFQSLKEAIASNPAAFYESLFAFIFTIAACVFLLFSIVKVKTLGGKEAPLTGLQVFFGRDGYGFNGFRFAIYTIPVLGILLMCVSKYVKVFKGMSSLFLIISAVLVICIPQLIDPSGSIYKSVELSTFAYFAIGLFIVSGILLFMSEYADSQYSVSEIAETSMLLAMAVIFQYIKIYSTEFGSINLQIVPLALIALRCKPSRSFLATGVVFGMITCLLDGYGLYTYPLEYLIAFGSISILSYFRRYVYRAGKPTAIGFAVIPSIIMLSTIVRYFMCCADAVIFWEYSWTAAFAGAALPVFISGLFAAVTMELLYIKPLFLINKLFPPADFKETTDTDVVVDTIESDNTF